MDLNLIFQASLAAGLCGVFLVAWFRFTRPADLGRSRRRVAPAVHPSASTPHPFAHETRRSPSL